MSSAVRPLWQTEASDCKAAKQMEPCNPKVAMDQTLMTCGKTHGALSLQSMPAYFPKPRLHLAILGLQSTACVCVWVGVGIHRIYRIYRIHRIHRLCMIYRIYRIHRIHRIA